MTKVFRVPYEKRISEAEWTALKKRYNYTALLTESTGRDNIPDKPDCFSLPDYSSDSVRQWVVFALLWLTMNMNKSKIGMGAKNLWRKGIELKNKNCLIIGANGDIGGRVNNAMKGLGLNTFGFDILIPQDNETRLLHLLERVHVIVFCCPLNATTANYFKPKHYEAMKNKPFIINPIRGALLDLQLVNWAIQRELISGYALDEMVTGALRGSNQCLFTPHIASWTKEAQDQKKIAVKNKVSEIHEGELNANL